MNTVDLPAVKFLLTHLSRGATRIAFYTGNIIQFLLTHLSRGATMYTLPVTPDTSFLLTHLSRGATTSIKRRVIRTKFLLTHLSRGATAIYCISPPVPHYITRWTFVAYLLFIPAASKKILFPGEPPGNSDSLKVRLSYIR